MTGGYRWSPCPSCRAVALRMAPHDPALRCNGCGRARPECSPDHDPAAPPLCWAIDARADRCELPVAHIGAHRFIVQVSHRPEAVR